MDRIIILAERAISNYSIFFQCVLIIFISVLLYLPGGWINLNLIPGDDYDSGRIPSGITELPPISIFMQRINFSALEVDFQKVDAQKHFWLKNYYRTNNLDNIPTNVRAESIPLSTALSLDYGMKRLALTSNLEFSQLMESYNSMLFEQSQSIGLHQKDLVIILFVLGVGIVIFIFYLTLTRSSFRLFVLGGCLIFISWVFLLYLFEVRFTEYSYMEGIVAQSNLKLQLETFLSTPEMLAIPEMDMLIQSLIQQLDMLYQSPAFNFYTNLYDNMSGILHTGDKMTKIFRLMNISIYFLYTLTVLSIGTYLGSYYFRRRSGLI